MNEMVIKSLIKPLLPKAKTFVASGKIDGFLQERKKQYSNQVNINETVEILVTTEGNDEYVNFIALENGLNQRFRVISQMRLTELLVSIIDQI